MSIKGRTSRLPVGGIEGMAEGMGWDPGCWVVLLMGPKKHKAVEKNECLVSDLGVLSCGVSTNNL